MHTRTHQNLLPGLLAVSVIALSAIATSASAADYRFEAPYQFRDYRDFTSVGGSVSDVFQVGADVVSTATGELVPGLTTLVARSNASGTEYSMFECGPTYTCYLDLIPYDDAEVTGGWTIEGQAENGHMPTNMGSLGAWGRDSNGNLLGGRGALPVAQNPMVAESSMTPTFEWDLPGALQDHLDGKEVLNDGNVNRWRIRVNRVGVSGGISVGEEIFDMRRNLGMNLALDTTSYTLPDGFITEPGDYLVQIMLEGTQSRTFNRARVRVPFTVAPVPVPAALPMLAGAIALLIAFRRRSR